jgi:outer membrane biosynthesis protein TonB
MLKALLQFRHRGLRRDLSAYLDDMLSERARHRLEAHLGSCEACRQELAELRVTAEALKSLPMAEVPRSFSLAAAPAEEVRPRPVARRAEFGLRLATATVAFALAVVLIGDFAGLPGGGDEEEEVWGELYSAARETPGVTERAPADLAAGITEEAPEAVPTPEAAPTREEAPEPADTPVPAATPSPAPEDTPSPAPTPSPEATPEPYLFGITEPEPTAPEGGAGVAEEEEPSDKTVMEPPGITDDAEADAAEAQIVAEEDGGGLSRGDVVRWLEVGLGAGAGLLLVSWALARLQGRIGNRT